MRSSTLIIYISMVLSTQSFAGGKNGFLPCEIDDGQDTAGKCTYKNGTKDGPFTDHPDGNNRSGNFKANKLDGEIITKDSQERLFSKFNYANGRMTLEEHFEEGILISRSEYRPDHTVFEQNWRRKQVYIENEWRETNETELASKGVYYITQGSINNSEKMGVWTECERDPYDQKYTCENIKHDFKIPTKSEIAKQEKIDKKNEAYLNKIQQAAIAHAQAQQRANQKSLKQYQRCIASAGGDIEELQKCQVGQ